MTVLAVLVGALLIGAALGLLGGGGTILTVPLLHGLLGVATPQAIAMSLPIVAVAAAVGAAAGWWRGLFAITPALALAATTSVGAFTGARWAAALPAHVQSLLLSLTLLAAGAAMFASSRRRRAPAEPSLGGAPVTLALAGLGIGVLTGVVGVGGGFILVPALVSLGGYTLAEAVPASLFVIAISATAGAAGYAGVAVPSGTVAMIAAVTAVGVLLGAAAARRVAPVRLQLAFSFVLVAASGYVFAHR